jgi:hypothetical protein
MSRPPLAGHCHCGAVRVLLDASRPTDELPLAACGCGFCRRHGALHTSDPAGHLHIEAAPGAVMRYRFGTRTAEFLMCAECGCYVAATMETEDGLLAVLNIRGVDLPGFEGRSPKTMSFDDQSADARVSWRRSRWTPAIIVEAQPNA